jgi:hypothetical protein
MWPDTALHPHNLPELQRRLPNVLGSRMRWLDSHLSRCLRHDGGMTEWLSRRTVVQYGLILWSGGVLCILLVFAVLAWAGGGPFNLALFLGLAIAIPLVGLPVPLWRQRGRLQPSRHMPDTQN